MYKISQTITISCIGGANALERKPKTKLNVTAPSFQKLPVGTEDSEAMTKEELTLKRVKAMDTEVGPKKAAR